MRSPRTSAFAVALVAASTTACTLLVNWSSIHEDDAAPLDAADESDDAATTPDVREGAADAYVAAVLADHPVAYYRFDALAANRVVSLVDGGPSGNLEDTASIARSASLLPNGAGLAVAGGDVDFGEAFAFLDDGSAAFTIELWVMPLSPTTSYPRVFSRESATPTGTFLFASAT